MQKGFIILVAVLFGWIGCEPVEQAKPPADANEAYYESIKHLTGLEHQPRMQRADSAEIIFYDNPDGDPKRYTRFYKSTPTNDTAIIAGLKSAVNKHFIRIEKPKDCRSEGKFHLFSKGDPMQTVYFSNRGDSCSFLYFIADGWFFYMDFDTATASLLSKQKLEAVVPSAPTL